jgi:hypothetical protein
LSLRVPQTQSVPGLAPLPLLNAGGGSGGSDLDMLLTALLKAFGQGGVVGGFSGRQAGAQATPRVRPGIDEGPQGVPQPMPQPRPPIPRDFPPYGGPLDTTQAPTPTAADLVARIGGGVTGGRPRDFTPYAPAPDFPQQLFGGIQPLF